MSSIKKLNGADYLLLLFYLPGKTGQVNEPISGRTRITKMMFIFKKEIFPKLNLGTLTSEEDLPQFKPYHYGPFSSDVHEQLDLFTNIDFLTAKEIKSSHDLDLEEDLFRSMDEEDLLESEELVVTQYQLTEAGINYVEQEILPIFDKTPDVLKILALFKKKINSMPLDAILSYVYNKYPSYAEKSRIREKVK
jgi:uncharacterized protein